MLIVFDEAKRLSNLRKHGLDMDGFVDGFDFRTARRFEAYTSRTGRTRFALIGWLGGELVVVAIISPLGSEALSLVSLRTASLTERTLHGFA